MVLSELEELRFIISNQVNIKMDDRENLERERERRRKSKTRTIQSTSIKEFYTRKILIEKFIFLK